MAINVSAKKNRLLVGGEDYSAALVEVKLDDTDLGQSGFITTTGSIVLVEVQGLPGSLDDRQNPLFRVGQTIVIDTTNESGVLERHPRGATRIISSEYNFENRQLLLRVGCLLTLLSFKQPTVPLEGQDPEQISEIDSSPSNSRLDIVTRLLNQASITNINCPYTIPYPITYTVEPTGSYVETAGKILYSAGYVGWIDRYEVLQIKPVILSGNATVTLQIGTDAGQELWYRRVTSSEGAREIVKVVGMKKLAQRIPSPQTTTQIRYGSAKTVDPEAADYTIVVEQTEISETFGGATATTTTNTYKPLGLVLTNLQSGRFLLSLVERTIETKTYEASKKGKLLSISTQVYKVYGQILAEYVKSIEENGGTVAGQTNVILAEQINTNYTYDSKERPSVITTVKSETTGALLTGINTDWTEFTTGLTALRTSESKIETWTHRQGITWKHQISGTKVLSRLHPELIRDDWEISQKLSLLADEQVSITEISNSGQTVPPAPERRPPRVTWVDKRTCGQAQFSQYGGNPLRERERTYSIEYLEGGVYQDSNSSGGSSTGSNSDDCNDAQCNAAAQIEGALLHGRFKGQDLGIALMDELFDWQPLMRVNCVEPPTLTRDNQITRAFCLDDAHWLLTGEKALCNFGCVWVGDVASVKNEVAIATDKEVLPGDTSIEITNPINQYIPAGTTLNIAGVNLTVTIAVNIGDTTISIAPATTTIASGEQTIISIPALQLPYQTNSRFVLTNTGGINFKHYPYSIATFSTHNLELNHNSKLYFVSFNSNFAVFGDGYLGNNSYLNRNYRLGNLDDSLMGNQDYIGNNLSLKN